MLSSFTGSFQAGKRAGTVQPFTANIVQSGLFAHFESSYPDSYPGTGTSWFDLEGNSSPAILQNGTDYSLFNNGVFVLDGIDDYISVPDSAVIRGSSVFTLQLWINVSSFNDKDRIFEKITSNAGYSLQLRDSAQLALQLDGSPNDYYVVAGSSIPLNTWIFITATISFNSAIPSKVYVNNTENLSISNIQTNVGSNTSILKVNSGQVVGSREPISRIGAIYIYNKVLTTNEIQTNFDATKGRFGVA